MSISLPHRLVGAALLSLAGAATASHDPTALSVEELLEVSVTSASKFPQRATEAPASVTVITADDIRAYGYRTLADILKSVRGFFVSYDRNYGYLGVRGFERPGDYNARILLLVDGYRVNDTIYDTAGIATDFAVDVDLIERLEIVRGAGSAIYGSNAFFAVINVITRAGRAVGPLEASVEAASFGADKQRLATGGRAGGLEWLLGASRYHSDGDDHYYAGYADPATNDGHAAGIDGDRYEKALGKVSGHGLALHAGYSRREKQVPTASFGSRFNDGRLVTVDTWQFVDLSYERSLDDWSVAPRVSWGRYEYTGDYPYGPGASEVNRDFADAQWWSSELKALGRLDAHRLVAGVEYQDNYQQDQLNYDEDPYALYLDDRRSSSRAGVYVEDEVTLADPLRVSAGLRFDHYSTAGDALSPRVGLVWSATPATALKLLGGTAFRAPNNYELYYGDNLTLRPNPGLDPEKITTYELIAEHYFDRNFRATVDAYQSRIRNLIEQVVDPVDGSAMFRNVGKVQGRGVEVELERVWAGDTRARASYAWQQARNLLSGLELTNSPAHLAKLNLVVPVLGPALAIAPEVQYASSRVTLANASTGVATVVNLTLSSRWLRDDLAVAASAYNLLDADVADPARPEHAPQLDTIAQDGRHFRLKLTYAF